MVSAFAKLILLAVNAPNANQGTMDSQTAIVRLVTCITALLILIRVGQGIVI